MWHADRFPPVLSRPDGRTSPNPCMKTTSRDASEGKTDRRAEAARQDSTMAIAITAPEAVVIRADHDADLVLHR